MLSRLRSALDSIESSLRTFSFAEYAQTTYDLLWRDFCDWYLEAIKPTVGSNPTQRSVLAHTLESIVRVLHPIAPFITEAIWERLREIETAPIAGINLAPARVDGLLATAGWPRIAPDFRDEPTEKDFERLRGLITAIREVRAQHNVPPKRRITLHAAKQLPAEHEALIKTLAMVETVTTERTTAPAVPFTFDAWEYRLSNLKEEVDVAAETNRLEKLISDLTRSQQTLDARLNNPGYTEKAPPHMVQQTRDQLAKNRAELEAAKAALRALKGGA
jgi:valyl-tRNA synthetase